MRNPACSQGARERLTVLEGFDDSGATGPDTGGRTTIGVADGETHAQQVSGRPRESILEAVAPHTHLVCCP